MKPRMKKGGHSPRRESKRGEASPARRTAAEILRRVEEEGAYAAPLLAHVDGDFHAADRALCYELVLGTLRRQLWLDRLIAHYANRRADSLDAPVRRALRLGLYQLRFLTRIPASAAVDESVKLVHQARLSSASGFVNAVLRHATREPDFDPAAGITEPIERISVTTSHPVWLIERWVAAFGISEAEAFAKANNEAAPVAFRLNTLRDEAATVIDELRSAGARIEPSKVAPGGWRLDGPVGPQLLRLAAAGVIYIQDEASQLVAHVLAARPGERVLDVCAAPGGKATHVALLTGDTAPVVAGDVYDHRLRIVRETAALQGCKSIRPVVHNAEAAVPFADGVFDRVLVDAPCTGTGTLRRNPEIRWRISNADIAELAARQGNILANASRVVRGGGGRLVYSTCSVEPEENEAVVAGFLNSHPDFRQVPVRPAASATPSHLTTELTARTWPHRDEADGFFVAAFVRER